MSVLTHSRRRVPPSSPRAGGLSRALAWPRHVDRLLTWRRVRAYALVLVALFVVAWVDVLLMGSPPLNSSGTPLGGDYIAFHTAGRLLLSGRASEIYDHAAVSGIQDSLLGGRVPNFYDAFRNPPFYAVLFAPLALLDLLPGFAVYALLSLACLALALRLLLDEAPGLRDRWRGLVVLVLAFPPVYFGLIDGENAVISLLLYALIYRALAREQHHAAGIWAALGLFKPQLFFIFPLVFLASRRWRALLAYALTAVALLAISLAIVGVEGMQAWLRILVEPESGNATANAWRMASLKSFFDLLLPGQHLASLVLYAISSLALLAALFRTWSRFSSSMSSGVSSRVTTSRSSSASTDVASGLFSVLSSRDSSRDSSYVCFGLSGDVSSSVAPGPSSVSSSAVARGLSSRIASLVSSLPWQASSLPALWACTSLVAVLVDPHLVDYDLTILVPAAIVAVSLIRQLRWWIVLLYILTLFRAQVPIGDSAVQLTTLVLGVLTLLAWRHTAALTRAHPSGPLSTVAAGHTGARARPT